MILLTVAMVITPVVADLTGYTQATYDSEWDIADMGTWKGRVVEDGIRWWRHITIENMGSVTLTEAKARIVVTYVTIGGVKYTSASMVDGNLVILNGEKIAPKTYLINLGTIQPDHTRKILLNVLIAQPLGFGFGLSVWYLA